MDKLLVEYVDSQLPGLLTRGVSPMKTGDMFPKLRPKRQLDNKANNKTPHVKGNGAKWWMFDQPTHGEIHPQREWTRPNLDIWIQSI